MSKNKILILFAHPLFEKSNANRALVNHIPKSDHITFHDLYEEYPDFDIDIKREQQLLLAHDIIIWHHPMYWYSCPPLLKQWIDLVLEHGWAYGKRGRNLIGKPIFQVITTGGDMKNYCKTGSDRFTIPDLLEPFNQTAEVCYMDYLPPFVVHGTHNMSEENYDKNGRRYGELLHHFENNMPDVDDIRNYSYMNDWFELKTPAHGY